jgi:DNA polymerase elongation subunit (family B)
MGTVIPKKFHSHLKYMKIVHRKDFYGFTNNAMFPYIKIRVSTTALLNILKKYFSDPAQVAAGFKICESNLDPFLRFIHENDIQPCGWVQLPAGSYSEFYVNTEDTEGEQFSRASYNVEIDYENVKALRYNKIAPLLVASFDIECTSSHGDFPVAKKDYKKLAVDLIAAARNIKTLDTELIKDWIARAYAETFQVKRGVEINRLYTKQKQTEASINRLLTDDLLETLLEKISLAVREKGSLYCDSDDEEGDEVEEIPRKKAGDSVHEKEIIELLTDKLPPLKGDPIIQIGTTVNVFGSDKIVYKHIVTLNTCSDIEDAEVESFDTEGEVLLAWKEFICRLDPDILTGYNILGFDMKYMWERAQEAGVCAEVKGGDVHFRASNALRCSIMAVRWIIGLQYPVALSIAAIVLSASASATVARFFQ